MKNEFEKILRALREASSEEAESGRFSEDSIRKSLQNEANHKVRKRLEEEFLGSGPLHSLIDDPEITEIIIDGKDLIFFEKQGLLKKHEDQFLSHFTFENFIHKIAGFKGEALPRLDRPFADMKWRDFRVHIITSPLTERSHHITLRKHPRESWTFEKLKEKNWAPIEAIELLKKLIKKKQNILIAGPTSSGKTSVLNACLSPILPNERVISIEDADELNLSNPFSVKLLTRLSTPHLQPIDQSILVQQSLRMRPDRIVMGEVRGPEAGDLMMALATGHQGSMGTLHACHHKQALIRLEFLISSGKPSWNFQAIRQLILLGIHIVVVLNRDNMKRRLKGIYQITGLEETGFLFDTLFEGKPQLKEPVLTNEGGGPGHQA